MSTPETLPAPAEVDDEQCIFLMCGKCFHEHKVTANAMDDEGRPTVVVDSFICSNCGVRVVVPPGPAVTFSNPTPEFKAAYHAAVRANDAANERVNARVERCEQPYPPMVLCACCDALVADKMGRPEDHIARLVDYDVNRDKCSSCAAPLGPCVPAMDCAERPEKFAAIGTFMNADDTEPPTAPEAA